MVTGSERLGSLSDYTANFMLVNWNRDSDWLRAGRPKCGSLNLGRVKNLHFSISSRLAEANPATYPMDTGGSFLGGNRAGA
jgi:hypothetical protein